LLGSGPFFIRSKRENYFFIGIFIAFLAFFLPCFMAFAGLQAFCDFTMAPSLPAQQALR
jgi:hypothetical protein